MAYIVLILTLFIVLILLKNKKILLKVKIFFKKCKFLVVLELLILIGLMIFNIFNGVVKINEKDPHTKKVLKSANLKQGETYTYKNFYYEKSEELNEIKDIIQKLNDIKDMMQNYKEKTNIIKIEDIGITKVKVSINENEKDYKYGTGFSYYSITSCNCGTIIVFERILTEFIKIILIGVVIIDLFIIVFIKIKEQK